MKVLGFILIDNHENYLPTVPIKTRVFFPQGVRSKKEQRKISTLIGLVHSGPKRYG